MKKKTWYFYYKERGKLDYVFHSEKVCKSPRRTNNYKELQRLLNQSKCLSISFTDEKKVFAI